MSICLVRVRSARVANEATGPVSTGVRWRVTRPSYTAVGRLTLWAEAARCERGRGVRKIAGSERWTCLTAATRSAACPRGVGSSADATCFHNDNSSGNGAGPLISGARGGRGRARVIAKCRGQRHSRRDGCLSWGSPLRYLRFANRYHAPALVVAVRPSPPTLRDCAACRRGAECAA